MAGQCICCQDNAYTLLFLWCPCLLQTDHQTPRRVPSSDMPVFKGGYIRAHVHPKRFGAVYRVPDWRARILQVTDHYVVVDKPAGVQAAAQNVVQT
eukprot:1152042-Pelagomonas_calceolata.AAC.4